MALSDPSGASHRYEVHCQHNRSLREGAGMPCSPPEQGLMNRTWVEASSQGAPECHPGTLAFFLPASFPLTLCGYHYTPLFHLQ